MAWPNDPCPPGDITTAADFLDYIVFKAVDASPPNVMEIITLAFECKNNLHSKVPVGDTHCEHVFRAKFFADAGDWLRVANELNHGT